MSWSSASTSDRSSEQASTCDLRFVTGEQEHHAQGWSWIPVGVTSTLPGCRQPPVRYYYLAVQRIRCTYGRWRVDSVGVRELAQRASAVVAEVEAGQRVVV